MNFIISLVLIFIGTIFYSFAFSQILLSSVIGLPMFKYALNNNIINRDTPNKYILTIIIWIIIIIFMTTIIFYFTSNYTISIITSIIFSVFNSLYSLKFTFNNEHNWIEFIQTYEEYLSEDFINNFNK